MVRDETTTERNLEIVTGSTTKLAFHNLSVL